MPSIDAHDPGTHLLDRPRQHRRGRGDGILLRAVRLDCDASRSRTPAATACSCTTAGRWRAWRPCGATPTGRRGRRTSPARTPTRPARPRSRTAARSSWMRWTCSTPGAWRSCAIRPAPRSRSGSRATIRATRCTASPGRRSGASSMTRDLASARAFYNAVFGWTAQEEDFDGVPVHGLEAPRPARRRSARDGRELARGHASRTGWSTSRRPTATRRRGAAASSAARSGIRRTTSARAAAPCSRIRRAASFSVITLASTRPARRGGMRAMQDAVRSDACRPSRSAPRSPDRAPAPGSSARSASSPTPRRLWVPMFVDHAPRAPS